MWRETQYGSAQRNTLVYIYDSITHSHQIPFTVQHMSTSMKFAFVEHICKHVLLIYLTSERKLALNLSPIEPDPFNYTLSSLLCGDLSFSVNIENIHVASSRNVNLQAGLFYINIQVVKKKNLEIHLKMYFSWLALLKARVITYCHLSLYHNEFCTVFIAHMKLLV